MKNLANIFSVLSLDVEDDNEQTTVTAQENSPKSSGGGSKTIEKELMPEKDAKGTTEEGSTGTFKSPLVWIDLEMTGLDVGTDRILEIACIITDGTLAHLAEGPDLIIYQTKECLDNMGEWCQTHHSASGLTEKVLKSNITEADAEIQVIDFLKSHLGGCYKPLLAGNSVYVDFQFLKKYMPELASMFSHVLVDVSSVSALCFRWYPKGVDIVPSRFFSLIKLPVEPQYIFAVLCSGKKYDDEKTRRFELQTSTTAAERDLLNCPDIEYRKAPKKQKKHRAMDDIKESIMELKYFKDNIFKCSRR